MVFRRRYCSTQTCQVIWIFVGRNRKKNFRPLSLGSQEPVQRDPKALRSQGLEKNKDSPQAQISLEPGELIEPDCKFKHVGFYLLKLPVCFGMDETFGLLAIEHYSCFYGAKLL